MIYDKELTPRTNLHLFLVNKFIGANNYGIKDINQISDELSEFVGVIFKQFCDTLVKR